MLERIRDGLARRTIFISYRRTDSGGYSGQLLAELEDHYGPRALFLDHQDIVAGENWEAALTASLDAADVVVVVIGPEWVHVEDDAGRRRIDDPDDWVRREVESGLARPDTTVIPVLVGNATMPSAGDLPPSLAPLLGQQDLKIRPDNFAPDVARLIRTIGGWRSHWYGVSVLVWIAVAVVLASIAGLVFALTRGGDVNQPPTVPEQLSMTVEAGERTEIDLLEDATDEESAVVLSSVDPLSTKGARIEPVGDGVVAYEPVAGFHGADAFAYQVSDEDGGVAEGRVSVNVLIGPMDGDFNVAVADFARVDREGASVVDDESSVFAERVFDDVSAELTALNEAGNFNFEVRPPTDTGPIAGSSRGARAAAARNLAQEIEADVVVYGTLTDKGVLPEFFIQSRRQNLDGAEELTGDHELGSRILASPLETGRITDNSTTLSALASRARALTQFVIGLSWYGGQHYEEALAAFELADEPDWRDEDGKEIVYLFLGNASGKLSDFTPAMEYYETALDLNREFARALLGSAEVEFFRAAIEQGSGTCGPGEVDPAGLRRSEDTYLRARAADDQPTVSNVEAKTAFGLGRVHLCATRALIEDRSTQARREFRAVVDEYEGGNESIRALAAEAYAGLASLGFLYVETDDIDALCETVALYDQAIELADDARADVFATVRSEAEDRLDVLGGSCG